MQAGKKGNIFVKKISLVSNRLANIQFFARKWLHKKHKNKHFVNRIKNIFWLNDRGDINKLRI